MLRLTDAGKQFAPVGRLTTFNTLFKPVCVNSGIGAPIPQAGGDRLVIDVTMRRDRGD